MPTVRRRLSRGLAKWGPARPRPASGLHGADASALAAELVASSPLGLAYLDRDLRYRWVNRVLAGIAGLTIEDHLGRTPMELLPGIDADQYLPGLLAILDGRQSVASLEISGRTRATHGGVRRWAATVHAVPAPDGAVQGIGIVVLDVTERVAAEEARRREEATARLILEAAPNGMMLVDAVGVIVAVNPEAGRLFGYGPDELVGCSVEALLPARFATAHPDLRRGYLADSNLVGDRNRDPRTPTCAVATSRTPARARWGTAATSGLAARTARSSRSRSASR